MLNNGNDSNFTPSEVSTAVKHVEDVYAKAGATKMFQSKKFAGARKFDLEMQEEAFAWIVAAHGAQKRRKKGLCFCCASSPRKRPDAGRKPPKKIVKDATAEKPSKASKGSTAAPNADDAAKAAAAAAKAKAKEEAAAAKAKAKAEAAAAKAKAKEEAAAAKAKAKEEAAAAKAKEEATQKP